MKVKYVVLLMLRNESKNKVRKEVLSRDGEEEEKAEKRKQCKRSFICGSGSAKILLLPLPHRLFDLRVTWRKSFAHFPM